MSCLLPAACCLCHACRYIHIGCDEVQFQLMNDSAKIASYMDGRNITRSGSIGFKSLIAM